MPNVTKIESKLPAFKQKKKVAAYARVNSCKIESIIVLAFSAPLPKIVLKTRFNIFFSVFVKLLIELSALSFVTSDRADTFNY